MEYIFGKMCKKTLIINNNLKRYELFLYSIIKSSRPKKARISERALRSLFPNAGTNVSLYGGRVLLF